MFILLLFLFFNRQAELFYGKDFFDAFQKPKSFTTEEMLWIKEHGPLIYGGDFQNPPFRFLDEKNKAYEGIILDYLKELSKEIGVEISFKPMTIAAAQEALINGEIDFTDMLPSIQKDQYYEFTYPMFKVRGYILLRTEDREITYEHQLLQQRVALRKNDYAQELLSHELHEVDYYFTDNIAQGIKALHDYEVRAVVGDELALHYIIKDLALEEKFRFSTKPLYEKNYVLAVQESNKMLYTILNKAIHNIEYKNKVEDIQRKWFGASISLKNENISEQITLLTLVLFMAVSMIFYFFYASNKTLFKELEQRMEELSLSRNDLQITFDGLTHYMIVLDQSLRVLNINEAFCFFLKIHRNRVLGKYCMDLSPLKKLLQEIEKPIILKTFHEGKHHEMEFEYGESFFRINTFPLKDKKQRTQKILVMLEDITKARISERQLLQQNKMAAVGQLAAGVAHEIRNPLGLIRNYCYILKNNINRNELMTQKAIDIMEAAVEKSSSIINNLLNFSKISNDQWIKVNLKDYLEALLSLQVRALKMEKIAINVFCSNDLWCYVNGGALESILLNLIANSIDAMTQGGNIQIYCTATEDRLYMDFTDTGEGIPQEVLPNIFNPFFTTKGKDKGTGLGLYIAYNEMQKMGGDIRVSSEIHKGTTFHLSIPLKGDFNGNQE